MTQTTQGRNFHHRLSLLVLLCGVLSLSGCGKPGNSATNLTNSFVAIVSMNDDDNENDGGGPLQSDVLTNGYATDDIISVTFQSQPRHLGPGDSEDSSENPTDPDGPSPFDAITLHSYHVSHVRSDGGPNPPDFTAGMNVYLPPNSDETVTVKIVVVRAFDKHRTPLKELRDDGEIFTTTVITFYGEDGFGNDIAVSGSIAISFANFSDSESSNT